MDEDTPRLLLEGRPGIGKTTLARRLLHLLQAAGVPVGGFTTAELRTGGRREGFVVEAASGAQAVLAHVRLPGPPRVGRYGVDLAAFERVALPALGTPRTGGVVVVDELGKMELASAAFCDAVEELLGRHVAVVATVHLARHPFTDALRRRPDVQSIRSPRPSATPCPCSSWNAWSAAGQGSPVEHDVHLPGGGGPGQAGGPRARLGPAHGPVGHRTRRGSMVPGWMLAADPTGIRMVRVAVEMQKRGLMTAIVTIEPR